jgi:hypothetical protein
LSHARKKAFQARQIAQQIARATSQ